ncbi:MAG TPA: hypothetical protein VLC10_02840, partial [Patescibacteria group bacterium]|nr:hypothetical protein [Patescibacteria group bacterium]
MHQARPSRLTQVFRAIFIPSIVIGLFFAAGNVAYGDTTNAASERIGPRLSIDIPGLTFQRIDSVGAYIDVPWISNYISAVYSYAVGVAGLLAGVMFVIGGFQYLTAGGDASRVSQGRDRITN